MLGDEGETHPSSAAAPAKSCHRSTAERIQLKVDSDPFAKPSRHDRYLRIPAGWSRRIALKNCLIAAFGADSLLLGGGDSADDGRTAGDAGGAVLRLQP